MSCTKTSPCAMQQLSATFQESTSKTNSDQLLPLVAVLLPPLQQPGGAEAQEWPSKTLPNGPSSPDQTSSGEDMH